MNGRVMLPTFDIVTECQMYDPVFHFLANGVRDVIEAAVLGYPFHITHGLSSLDTTILVAFEEYFSRYEQDFPQNPHTRRWLVDEYFDTQNKIQLVAVEIEAMVEDMLKHLFSARAVEIDPKTPRWRGRDLIVSVRGF